MAKPKLGNFKQLVHCLDWAANGYSSKNCGDPIYFDSTREPEW